MFVEKIFKKLSTRWKIYVCYKDFFVCYEGNPIPNLKYPQKYFQELSFCNNRQGHEFHLSLVKNKYLKFRNFFENLDLILKI